MKIEINIPDGWERDTSEFPEHYWPAEDMIKVYVPFRRKDTREDWQKRIDELIEKREPWTHIDRSGGLMIAPDWTYREYKGWKYYTSPSLPDWVVSTPHREGWDWLHQDGSGVCYESVTVPFPSKVKNVFWADYIHGWNKVNKTNPPTNFLNERYHWEGQWVHRPWGCYEGEN